MDLDAFFVSVELLRRPQLRGKAVVVAGSGPRAVVTTASYEARLFGVGSAMPAAQARRLCPDAIFIEPDIATYRKVSGAVMGIVAGAAETVEVLGLDEAYLDLTGLLSPKAEMRRLIGSIAEQTGLSASVGIGPNKLVAKVASDAEKPRGFVVLSQVEACQRFAMQPPRLLPGIGPKTAAALEQMGIATLGDLAATPTELLIGRFGARTGSWLTKRAGFDDESPVSSERIAVSESRETTFASDISDPVELEAALMRLAVALAGALGRQGRRGATIAIKVRLDDFSTFTRSRTISAAINESDRIGAVAVDLLREFGPTRPVRLLGVRVSGFSAASTDWQQLALLV